MLFLGRIIHFICNGGIEIEWNNLSISIPFFPRRPVEFLDFDPYYSNDLKRLMVRLLSSNPVKRPSACEVLENSKKEEKISSPTSQPNQYNGICVKPKFETKLKRAWQPNE